MHWYTEVIQKYAVFSGRAGRPEFWWFTLINIIISIAINVVFEAVLGSSGEFIGGLYGLAVLLPSLGVAIRRLHDTNRSGWWILIGIIPLIGLIVLIVFYASEGTRDSNQYGDIPATA